MTFPSPRITPAPPKGWKSWEELMRLALHQAEKAAMQGEVPVGALVVTPEGEILAASGNSPIISNDPCAHAEVNALRLAGAKVKNYRLQGSFMVVTLEPCLMCAAAITHARLAGVVFGASDPKGGAIESCIETLDMGFITHRAWSMGGILKDECAKLLQDFFAARRRK